MRNTENLFWKNTVVGSFSPIRKEFAIMIYFPKPCPQHLWTLGYPPQLDDSWCAADDSFQRSQKKPLKHIVFLFSVFPFVKPFYIKMYAYLQGTKLSAESKGQSFLISFLLHRSGLLLLLSPEEIPTCSWIVSQLVSADSLLWAWGAGHWKRVCTFATLHPSWKETLFSITNTLLPYTQHKRRTWIDWAELKIFLSQAFHWCFFKTFFQSELVGDRVKPYNEFK